MLTDKKRTKTEIRKQARITTNTLSMETLAKIRVALDCKLDDIVEI